MELHQQYFALGLYSKIAEDPDILKAIKDIKWDECTYDGFCKSCNKMSVFQAKRNPEISSRSASVVAGLPFLTNAEAGSKFGGAVNFDKRLECTRCGFKILIYYCQSEANLYKVGSFPSVADLQIGEVLNDSTIPKNQIPRELTKAIGLRAHGAHIGAFSYLRRVYERMIIDAATLKATKETSWSIDEFYKLRAQEKIKDLEEYLPHEMVENRTAYGILSKGIHELEEDECDSAFDIMYNLIIMILEENDMKKKREDRKQGLKKSISDLAAKMK